MAVFLGKRAHIFIAGGFAGNGLSVIGAWCRRGAAAQNMVDLDLDLSLDIADGFHQRGVLCGFEVADIDEAADAGQNRDDRKCDQHLCQ